MVCLSLNFHYELVEFSSFVYFFPCWFVCLFLNKPGPGNLSSLLIRGLFSLGSVLFYMWLFINVIWQMGEKIVLVSLSYGGGIMNKVIMNVVSLKNNEICAIQSTFDYLDCLIIHTYLSGPIFVLLQINHIQDPSQLFACRL